MDPQPSTPLPTTYWHTTRECADTGWEFPHLTPGWQSTRMAPWTSLHPRNTSHSKHGWKIHVSTTLEEAAQTIRDVLQIARQYQTPIKHISGPAEYIWLHSKQNSRMQSGKAIVLYPESEDLAVSLAEALRAACGPTEGPHVITDKRLPNANNIYYRWGAFVQSNIVDERGASVEHIPDGIGGHYTDARGPRANWPDTIRDPFQNTGSKNPSATSLPDIGPYRVDGALAFSNAGGVYTATSRETGDKWVLKEARPSTGFVGSEDAIARLRREAEWSRRAQEALQKGVSRVKRVIEVQGHSFLPLTYVDGINWYGWVAENSPLFTPGETSNLDFQQYMSKVKSHIDSVSRMLKTLHNKSIAMGDLSDSNVLITRDNQPYLIDFELAGPPDASEPDIGTFEYSCPKPHKTMSRRQRDLYALDCLAITSVLRVQLKDGLNGIAIDRLQSILKQQGLSLPDWWIKASRRVQEIHRETVPRPTNERAQISIDETSRINEIEHLLYTGITNSVPSPPDGPFAGSRATINGHRISFAEGEAGIIYALARSGQKIPDALLAGFEERAQYAVSNHLLPAGIANGLAGIMLAADAAGMGALWSDAVAGLDHPETPSGGPTLYYGMAGAALIAAKHGRLDTSRTLLERAFMASEAYSWQRNGLFEGQCGLAHAATQISIAHGGHDNPIKEMERLAVKAFQRELSASTVEGPNGAYSYKSDRSGRLSYPYLSAGSAGVSVVLATLSLSEHGQSEHWRSQLEAFEPDRQHRLTVAPGLADGVAGLHVASNAVLAAQGLAKILPDATLADALDMHLVPDGNGGLVVLDSLESKVDVTFHNGSSGVLMALSDNSDPLDWIYV